MELNIFMSEVFGTMILILLGDGVVAGVLLAKSKANASGWIVITFAWAMAVFVGVIVAAGVGGDLPLGNAHLNPAVTLGLLVNKGIDTGTWEVTYALIYVAGEFVGAFIGAFLVFLHYYPHWAETEDKGLKLAVFCTAPAIRNYTWNFVSEVIGTFVLVFVILTFGVSGAMGTMGALARGPARPGHRPVPRRDDRLRDQPDPRPGAADHARDPADPGQGRLRLGLLLGPGRRPARRRRRRGARLPVWVHPHWSSQADQRLIVSA